MLDFVLKRLAERKTSLREISTGSGVPYDTLNKISQGQTKDPRFNSIRKLHDYFRGHKSA